MDTVNREIILKNHTGEDASAEAANAEGGFQLGGPELHEPRSGSAEDTSGWKPIKRRTDLQFDEEGELVVASPRTDGVHLDASGKRQDWLKQDEISGAAVRAKIAVEDGRTQSAPEQLHPDEGAVGSVCARYLIQIREVPRTEEVVVAQPAQETEARVLDTNSGGVQPRQSDEAAETQSNDSEPLSDTVTLDSTGSDTSDGGSYSTAVNDLNIDTETHEGEAPQCVEQEDDMPMLLGRSRGARRRERIRQAREVITTEEPSVPLPSEDEKYDMYIKDVVPYIADSFAPPEKRATSCPGRTEQLRSGATSDVVGREFKDGDGNKQVLLTGVPHVVGCPVFDQAYFKMGALPLMSSRKYKGRYMDWGCHLFVKDHSCRCHQVLEVKKGSEGKPWVTYDIIPGSKTDKGEKYEMYCMRYLWLIPLAGPVGLTDFVPTCACLSSKAKCWFHSHKSWWHHRGKLVALPIGVDNRGEKADYSNFDEAGLSLVYQNWVQRKTGRSPRAHITRLNYERETVATRGVLDGEERPSRPRRKALGLGATTQIYSDADMSEQRRKELMEIYGLHSIHTTGVLTYKIDASSVNVIPNLWGQVQAQLASHPDIIADPAAPGAHGIRINSRVNACNGIDPPLSENIFVDYVVEVTAAIDWGFNVLWLNSQMLDQLKAVSVSGYTSPNGDPIPSQISGVIAGAGAFNDKLAKELALLLMMNRTVVDNSSLYGKLFLIWYENWVFETVNAAPAVRPAVPDYQERETNPDPANINPVRNGMVLDMEERCFVFVGDEVNQTERDIMRFLAMDGPCYQPPAAGALKISSISAPAIPIRWYHRGVPAAAAMPALAPTTSDEVWAFMRKISALRREEVDMVRGITKAAPLVFAHEVDLIRPPAPRGGGVRRHNALMTASLEVGATLWPQPLDSNWMWRILGTPYLTPGRDRWLPEWTILTSMDGTQLVNAAAIWAATFSTTVSTVFQYFNFTGPMITRIAARQPGAWNHGASYLMDMIERKSGGIVPQIYQIVCWLISQCTPIVASPSCWLGTMWCAGFARIPPIQPVVAADLSLWSWLGFWRIPYRVDPLHVLFLLTNFLETWGYFGPGTTFNAYAETTRNMAPAGNNRWWADNGSDEYAQRLDSPNGAQFIHVSYANLWYNAFSQYFRVPVAGVQVLGSRWSKYMKSGKAVRGDDVNYPIAGAYIAVFNLAAGQFPTFDWHTREVLAPSITEAQIGAANWITLCNTKEIQVLNGGITNSVAPVPAITGFSLASMASIMATPSVVGGFDADFLGPLAVMTITNSSTASQAAQNNNTSANPGNAPGPGLVAP